MKSYTVTEVQYSISEVMNLDTVGEAIKITRWDGAENELISRAEFDGWQKLDSEFVDIMQHYGKSIEALTHR